ncbi:MAG: hypothetical protein LBP79_07315 [Clostridiales bacterium]|jgi:hypothetical protein|nr:hypothetical protein [Clostridiales bacterium]
MFGDSNYFILILIMLLLFSNDGEIKGGDIAILITTVAVMALCERRGYNPPIR